MKWKSIQIIKVFSRPQPYSHFPAASLSSFPPEPVFRRGMDQVEGSPKGPFLLFFPEQEFLERSYAISKENLLRIDPTNHVGVPVVLPVS